MLTFEDSKERCKDVGGELAAPLTEIEIRAWLIVIHINCVVYYRVQNASFKIAAKQCLTVRKLTDEKVD